MIGVHRSLLEYVRRRELAGAGIGEIARELPRQAEAAVALIERGLRDYAPRADG